MELGFTWEEYFSIRTDIIWYHGLFTKSQDNLNDIDQLCIRELGQFLMHGGVNHWKKFSELWKEYKDINGFNDSHENPDYSQKSKIRDMAMNGFYFGIGLSYEDGEPIGVLIPQPINIDYHNDLHKGFFLKLFPFRFRYLPADHKIQFLDFHLNETFKKDTEAYRLFLNTVKGSYKNIFGDNFDLLNQYIDGLKESNQVPVISSKYTVKQVVLSIVYLQMAGSIQEFNEGEKTIRLSEFGKSYGLSVNTLMTEYNSVSGNRSMDNRLKILRDPKNQAAVEEILKNDLTAIAVLKKEINKLVNPLP